MKKLRVLEVLGYSTWGGAAFSVLELLEELPRDRFEFTVVSPRGDAGFAEAVERAGVRWIEAPLAGRMDYQSFRTLKQLMERERFDVLHTNCRNADLIAGLAAWQHGGLPHVVHARGLFVDSQGNVPSTLVGRFYHLFLRRAPKRVIAISQAVADRAVVTVGVPADRVTVVKHAIDLTPFAPIDDVRRLEVRAGLGLEPGQRFALAIGSLGRCKGQDVLLEALAQLPDRSDVVVGLVGDGPDRETLAVRAAQPDLRGRVRFLGQRRDVAELLAAADVFVHPARWEGCGRVVMEAMAAGRPIVAAKAGGVVELVEHERSGLLVDVDAPAQMAVALGRLLDDSALANRFGAAAAVRAREQFAVERAAREIGEVFREVAAAERGAPQAINENEVMA